MPIRDLVEPAEQGLGEFDTDSVNEIDTDSVNEIDTEFDTDSVNAFKLTFNVKDTSDIYFSFISKHLRDY